MNKFSNFLWKIFSASVVIGYNTDGGEAKNYWGSGSGFSTSALIEAAKDLADQQKIDTVADVNTEFSSSDNSTSSSSRRSSSNHDDDSDTPLTIDDIYTAFANLLGAQSAIDGTVYSSYTSTEGTRRVEICPAGYYVSKCGNFNVGYNWLKSAYINEVQTNNYATASDSATRFDYMRKFFKGEYLPAWTVNSEGTIDTTTDPKQTKSQLDRDAILGAICNPNNIKKDSSFGFSCAPCPEAGNVGPSYVHTDYSASSLLIPNSWKFHSIADCYLSEFEDATGSFIYLPLNVKANSTNGRFCYYGDNISTEDFKKYFMGSTVGSVRTDTAASAPAQRYEEAPQTSN